jgi:phage terminase large subunit-like protein
MPRKKSRGLVNIRWIEKYCRIPEGPGVGSKVKLPPFMRDDLIAIYDNPGGTRRAILSRGRKNAKTTESAMLVLLHLCGPEKIENSNIYSAAQSREQAGILFGLAAKMVRLNPVLRAAVTIRDTKKELVCPELGTIYRALSAEASTAYGLSPSLVIHDELGQVKGPRDELFDALETATGAQGTPLSVIISTQARTDNDLFSILIDDALAGNDPRTVVRFHTAPNDIDPFSDEAIRAANPAFDFFQNRDEVRSMANDAKRMPARENEYRNLILNQRIEASAPFVTRETWRACGAQPMALDGCDVVFGGLDLSSTSDLTALVLIGKVAGVWQVEPHFWIPGEGLLERSRLDRVPYDVWKSRGYLETTPGKTVDYEWVVDQLLAVFKRYRIRKIAFDRWNFGTFKPYLLRAGMSEQTIEERFLEFRQDFREISPALKELDRHLKNGRIAHGNHPVLQMCAENAVVITDNHENIKLIKKKTIGRIDGMVALTMAIGAIPQPPPAPPVRPGMFIMG